jgi:hypothetical protein
MWNCKTLKIQRTFQNWSKSLKLQKFFATHKWDKSIHDVLKKVVIYYTTKHKNVKK